MIPRLPSLEARGRTSPVATSGLVKNLLLDPPRWEPFASFPLTLLFGRRTPSSPPARRPFLLAFLLISHPSPLQPPSSPLTLSPTPSPFSPSLPSSCSSALAPFRFFPSARAAPTPLLSLFFSLFPSRSRASPRSSWLLMAGCAAVVGERAGLPPALAVSSLFRHSSPLFHSFLKYYLFFPSSLFLLTSFSFSEHFNN